MYCRPSLGARLRTDLALSLLVHMELGSEANTEGDTPASYHPPYLVAGE